MHPLLGEAFKNIYPAQSLCEFDINMFGIYSVVIKYNSKEGPCPIGALAATPTKFLKEGKTSCYRRLNIDKKMCTQKKAGQSCRSDSIR